MKGKIKEKKKESLTVAYAEEQSMGSVLDMPGDL